MRKSLILFLLSLVLLPTSLHAQTVVSMSLQQNPPFEVSTHEVAAILGGTPLTLGGDVVVTGGSGNYTYRWYTAEGTLSTDRELTVSQSGEYQLDITDQCDCLQTVIFRITASTGIQTATDQPLATYDGSTLTFATDKGILQATLINAEGRLVRVATNYDHSLRSLSVADLLPGLYILNITLCDNTIYSQKFIKN